MGRFAEDTAVPADRSRAEVERTLQRYGADAFSYGWEGERAIVAFRAHGRMVKFVVPLPDKTAADIVRTPSGRRTRTPTQQQEAWEKATRQRWRALALAVKAKLEVVESGIATFEEEFLAYVMLPNGQTVGDWSGPQIQEAYDKGTMPALLPAGGTTNGKG